MYTKLIIIDVLSIYFNINMLFKIILEIEKFAYDTKDKL